MAFLFTFVVMMWRRGSGQSRAGVPLGGEPGLHLLGPPWQADREVDRALGSDQDVVLQPDADPRSSAGTMSSSGWKYNPGSTVSTLPALSSPSR